MADALAGLPSVLVVWGVTITLLHWGRLPGAWRRSIAILASAAGLVFLVLAVKTEGLRESPTTAVFLIGPSYVTERASASASLPYYVVTAVCLLLGTAGLAVADETARRLGQHWLALACALSLGVTATRFGLEKVAAPASWTHLVGVTWLAPVVGAFFAWNLRREGKGLKALLAALAKYAFIVRGTVAALMAVASTLRLGSHYDVSALAAVRNPLTGRLHEFVPGSVSQVLYLGVLPQLVAWPLYTVIAGLLGAGLARLGAPGLKHPPVPAIQPPVRMAAASEDR